MGCPNEIKTVGKKINISSEKYFCTAGNASEISTLDSDGHVHSVSDVTGDKKSKSDNGNSFPLKWKHFGKEKKMKITNWKYNICAIIIYPVTIILDNENPYLETGF